MYLSIFSRVIPVLNSNTIMQVRLKSIRLAPYLFGTTACTPLNAKPKKKLKILRSRDLNISRSYDFTIQKT
jgi:hypothetical protein